jgi:Uma2 family endonuclease
MSTTLEAGRKIWTEAELQTLPENGCLHELVNNELIISPKNDWQHGDICVRLLVALATFARAHRLGAVFGSSTGFWMANGNCRAPDIAFVSKERLHGLNRAEPSFFQGAPDLAVEIMAPSNSRQEINERLGDFFSSGTRLAWLVYPKQQMVEVCRSLAERRLLGTGACLVGEDVLPGFQYPIANLFTEWEW